MMDETNEKSKTQTKPMKLIILPFGGGNKYSYDFIRSQLPVPATVYEYPGHGTRIGEELIDNIEGLKEDFFANFFNPEVYENYAFWAHSMGSLVAYEVSNEISNRGLPSPKFILVSGSAAPSVSRDEPDSHSLPEGAFIEKLRKYGGTSSEVLENEELMNFFIPILRNDFKIHEKYVYKGNFKLDIPLYALNGDNEDVTENEYMAWQEETTSLFKHELLKGDHFFIRDHKGFILDMLKDLSELYG